MARVCMVVFNDYPNDPRVRREAEALTERGDAVDCICLQSGKEKAAVLHSVRLFSSAAGKHRGARPIRHLATYFHFFCFAFLKLTLLHLKKPYDVVQVHTMPDFLVFTALVPKLLGAKVILDIHDLVPELYMAKFGGDYDKWIVRLLVWIEKRSVAFADKTIAVHDPHLDVLVKHGNPREKFSVLLNVPDHRIFMPNASSGAAPKRFRLIYHGTIADRTGLDVALRAVARVRNEIPGLEFQIVGDGDGVGRLRSMVNELNLANCVQFVDAVPVDQLPKILRRAAVGIIPYAADGFTHYVLPTKLLEYAVLQIPAIVSRLHAIETYFDDEMVGYFEPGNEAQLAGQILKLYRRPEYAAKLAANAARFADRYNWPQQREVYFRMVDSLLPERRLLVQCELKGKRHGEG